MPTLPGSVSTRLARGTMRFQITVRYGARYQRYHTYVVDGANARTALELAARAMPAEIAAEADLVEVRVAVDSDDRPHPGEG